MQTILLQFLILFTNILLLCGNSHAAEWKYLGYATLDNNDTFYVFVDKTGSKNSQNEKIFLEKHVFNNQQILDESTIYMTAVLERALNCNKKQISNIKATMYDSNGNEIQSFIKKDAKNTQQITKSNNINYSVFREFCAENLNNNDF